MAAQESPSDERFSTKLAIMLIGLAAYAWLFGASHGFLADRLSWLLIPDELLRLWMGGNS